MTKKIENLILFDYYENHPLGIIYDWIRINPPQNTLVLIHLGYISYCKTGNFKLIRDNFIRLLSKKIRINILILI